MNMKSRLLLRVLRFVTTGLVLATFMQMPADAHHSFARFDQSNPATLSGTVKEFKLSNPHSWLFITAPNGSGGTDEWPLEGPPVNTLFRTGWTKDTLKPGMKVKVLIAPRKDGAIEGALLRLLEIDGQPTTIGTETPYQ